MTKTEEWAASHGVGTADILPPVEDNDEPYKRTAGEIAVRTVILHAVAAAGYGIDRQPIIEWLKKQDLWAHVSPREQEFLLSKKPRKLLAEDQKGAQWLQEAQWALLWTIQKVESLGLPIKTCDTIRMVDDIMPGLGEDIGAFISSAELRPTLEIRAEEDRITKLYGAAREASRQDEMPEDLIYGVLNQRHYAFKWVRSGGEWDVHE